MNQFIKWTLLGLLLIAGTPLAQAQKTPSEIYRETSPAVVLLMSSNPGSSSRFKGTGFIIKPGLILTNAHVVLGDNNQPLGRISAFLPSYNPNDDNQNRLKKGHRALVLFHDSELDLALLISKTLPDVTPIPFGNSEKVSIGDSVLAIGHPENGGLWSLTSGRVGSKISNFRKIQGKHVFQAEASINHGNSGGPLLNLNGQMIGVITSMYRTASDGSAITGINFALQSQVVHQWLKSHEVSVALHQTPQVVSSEASSGQSKISENQDMSVSAPSSALDSSEGTKPEKEPLTQSALPPVQNILPPAGSPPKLLTPPRPFQDEDLFGQEMDKIDKDFDQMMKKMEKEFDDEMEKEF
jgi:serine protease Do